MSDVTAAPALLEALDQLTAALTDASTPREVLASVLGTASVALGASSVRAQHFGAGGLTLSTEVSTEAGRGVTETAPEPGAQGAHVAPDQRQPEALFAENPDTLSRHFPALGAHSGRAAPSARVALPLWAGGVSLGRLTLDFDRPHTFTGGERQFLTVLAALASQALGRVQMQGDVAAQRLEQQVRGEALSAFAQLTQAAVSSLDPEVLLSRAREALNTIVPDVVLRLYERQGDGWTLTLTAPQGEAPPLPEAQPLPGASPSPGTPAFEHAARQTEPVFWPPGNSGLPPGVPGDPAMGALAPLFGNNQLTAMLSAASPSGGAWTPPQRAAFMAVWHGLRGALERAAQARRLERQEALDAFVAFTELTTQVTDVQTLAQQAVWVLRTTLDDVSVTYFTLDQGLWRARVWSEDLEPEVIAELQRGVPANAPTFSQAVQTRDVVFVDSWDPQREQVPRTDAYRAAAFFPYFIDTQPYGVLGMGTQGQHNWTERERTVFRLVGASLGLAIERTRVAQVLREQNAELRARTRALDGFASLTAELSVQQSPDALIRQSQELALSLLSSGYAVYYVRDSERWRFRVRVGLVGSATLHEYLDEGLVIGQTPSLDGPFESRQAMYQGDYAKGSDTPAELVQHVNAVAVLPVQVRGEVVGMFAVVLFEQRQWDGIDRVILETVVRSLELALERTQSVALLAERTQALERSNQELQAANEELEAFGYSVSHDLRSPVRHIRGFAELAQRAMTSTPNDKVSRHLGQVVHAADRMSGLIDAMLAHSRSALQELRPRPIDLAALVTSVRSELEPEMQGREMQWRISALPTVLADQDSLHLVLYNLLANAVKYTRLSSVAVIEVWADDRPGEWSISVRDNGAGFDPAYAHKLFGVFQRLHSDREFEGTGVGLATVRRIVVRHGGRVEATSQVGAGATFTFTLPR